MSADLAACDGTRLAGFGLEVTCGLRESCRRYKIAQKAAQSDRQVWVAAPFTVDKRSRSSCELFLDKTPSGTAKIR